MTISVKRILKLELPDRRPIAGPKRTFVDVVNKDIKLIDAREEGGWIWLDSCSNEWNSHN